MFKIFYIVIFASASAVDCQMVEESSSRTLVWVSKYPLEGKQETVDSTNRLLLSNSVNECAFVNVCYPKKISHNISHPTVM